MHCCSAYAVSVTWAVLLYLAGSSLGTTAAAAVRSSLDRSLLVTIQPDKPSLTNYFDSSLRRGSPDISADDPRILKATPGCAVPEQVHLTYWSSTSVLVSWATCDAQVTSSAPPPLSVNSNSVVIYGPAPGRYTQAAVGVATSYVYDYGKLKQASYASPLLHHVLLPGLTPGATYYYTLGVPVSPAAGAPVGPGPKEYKFTVPRAAFPLRLGVMSDPGQTENTSVVLQHLLASQPWLVLLAGDFTYADSWRSTEERMPDDMSGKYSYQPKWDTWGRLFEPLLSRVPLIHTDGNHEIEALPDGQRNLAYNKRFPKPSPGRAAPVSFDAVTSAAPYNNLYYAAELPGVFKVISLTSYSPDQEENGFGGEQYKWLQAELANTDRSVTPWLILLVHAPWYTTYASHCKENDCMRENYESLVAQYAVDIMLHGHVHAYERTKPVRNFQVDECGPVHITIGDGGNIEGLNKDFIDTMEQQPDFCDNPEGGEQFPSSQPERCISRQNGHYCFKQQPDWSAYREPSFGHGTLDLLNATHATWSWTKSQGAAFNVADQVTIIRGAAARPAQGHLLQQLLLPLDAELVPAVEVMVQAKLNRVAAAKVAAAAAAATARLAPRNAAVP